MLPYIYPNIPKTKLWPCPHWTTKHCTHHTWPRLTTHSHAWGLDDMSTCMITNRKNTSTRILVFPHRKRVIFAHHIARALDDSFNLTTVYGTVRPKPWKNTAHENSIDWFQTQKIRMTFVHSHVNPIEKLPHWPSHAHNPHAVMRVDCTTTLTMLCC